MTLGQANSIESWRTDEEAARYRACLAAAARCYFVSHANRKLTERQIAGELLNAEVVWNPYNVPFDASPRWPSLGAPDELRLASVARLHPPSKGQDILFEALAGETWKRRRWKLYLYGEGPMRRSLEWLAAKLELSERIVFAGFAGVEEIWTANHALVMPSRYEGMPLAVIEAMLCARPVIATDVAGHPEIIEDGVTGFLADAPTAVSFSGALERFWFHRGEAETMGKAGAQRVRSIVPSDPGRDFSDKLRGLMQR